MLINGFMHGGAHFFMCSMTLFFRHLLHNRVALPFRNSFTNVVVFCSVGHFDLSPTFLSRKWKQKISNQMTLKFMTCRTAIGSLIAVKNAVNGPFVEPYFLFLPFFRILVNNFP